MASNLGSHSGLREKERARGDLSTGQKAGDAMIKAKQLRGIAGAYFSGMGYYVEVLPEIPDTDLKPDVVGIKPKPKDVKLRVKKGAAPVGILYLLKQDEWMPTESIVEKTRFDEGFVKAVLRDSEEDGWVKSKDEPEDKVSWRIDGYRVPAEECVMMCCGPEDPLGALDVLEKLKGCFNRGYLLFPYQVDGEFLDRCSQADLGVLVFDERIACFRETIAAKHIDINNFRVYSSVCEKIVVDNCAFRSGEWW